MTLEPKKKKSFFSFLAVLQGGGGAGIMKVYPNGAKLGESHSYLTQTYFHSRNWVPIARRWQGPPCYDLQITSDVGSQGAGGGGAAAMMLTLVDCG